MTRTPDEILDALNEYGEGPEDYEVERLCVAAKQTRLATAELEALRSAMSDSGWVILDVIADEDDGVAVELLPPKATARRRRIRRREKPLKRSA